MTWRSCWLLWWACLPMLAVANDAAVHDRVRHIAAELRCLVCQNQSIADSNASLAQDLRQQIETMVAAGKSDGEIREYMVARYGDFVLYRPPLTKTTLLLWVAPFVILVLAIWQFRRRQRQLLPPALDPDEAQRAQLLLQRSASDDKP